MEAAARWEDAIEDGRRLFIVTERLGFVFKRYEPSAWWYEMVVMARKALIVAFSMLRR